MHDQIFDMLVKEDEISWKQILMNMVRTEQMNPWDVDISIITQKYVKLIKELKEMDFRLSGKVLLAAAILLRMKVNKLLDDDITELDRMISQQEELGEDEFYDEIEAELMAKRREAAQLGENIPLMPRVPHPRKRKVSIYDLVSALEQALEVKRRRVMNNMPLAPVEAPTEVVDMTVLVKQIYNKVLNFFSLQKKDKLYMHNIVPGETSADKIHTFVPLLHLSNSRRIDLEQEQHFGPIEIQLLRARARQETDQERVKSE